MFFCGAMGAPATRAGAAAPDAFVGSRAVLMLFIRTVGATTAIAGGAAIDALFFVAIMLVLLGGAMRAAAAVACGIAILTIAHVLLSYSLYCYEVGRCTQCRYYCRAASFQILK